MKKILLQTAAAIFSLPAASTVAAATPSRRLKSGYGSKILTSFVHNGRRFEFHATKGWRCYRA